MQTEIEVKFLAVNHDEVRDKLKKAGAHLEKPMRDMRRTIFGWPKGQLEKAVDGFLRVRDEGDQATMTYKVFNEHTVDGAGEIEIVVGDYHNAVELLKAIGMEAKSEQESKRETWQLDDCEVVLDEWPWLKPYIEIEGPSKEALQRVAAQLGFKWDDAVYGSVTSAYRHEYAIDHEISIGEHPRIAFSDPVPGWLEKIRKQK